MIPIKLQLKNFLSYGSELQTINFEPYSMICLSGKNGHGKSALLDAMTWALWGQARKGSALAKADQGLLRLGQRQMTVIFDFAFNGNSYRIKREFTNAYGKSYAYLDVAMIDTQDPEKLIALTGKTIKETQQKIIDIIGLDYETFVNSTFLRQGQSNEFSKKSPKERKEILCSILGIDTYERLKKSALEKVKYFLHQKEILEHSVQRLETEGSTLPALIAASQEVEQSLHALTTQEMAHQKERLALHEEYAILHEGLKERANTQFHYEETVKQSKELEQTIRHSASVWRTTHQELIRLQTGNAEALYQEVSGRVAAAKEKLDAYAVQRARLLSVREEEYRIRREHEQEVQRRLIVQKKEVDDLYVRMKQQEHSMHLLKERMQEYEKKLQALLKSYEYHQQILAKESVSSTFFEKVFERKKEFYHYLIHEGNRVTALIEDIKKKKEFSYADTPSCPLCLQSLSDDHKKNLEILFDTQEKGARARLNRVKYLVPLLKEMLLKQHNYLTVLKKEEEERALIGAQCAHEEKEIALLQTTIQESQNVWERSSQEYEQLRIVRSANEALCAQLEQELHNGVWQRPGYKELVAERTALEEIGKEEFSLLKVYEEDKKIEAQLLQERRMHEEYDQLKKEQREKLTALSVHIRHYRALRQKEITLKSRLTTYAAIVEHEQIITKKLEENAYVLHQLAQQKEALLEQKGTLQAQRDRLLKAEVELADIKKQISVLEKEIIDYKDIAAALSKDGIQALLIEEAVPELEHEANTLLARLTDNQCQLFIESLRDLKKGGVKETLDIKIADTAGIRDYELFSGGEAFRIDFALRIALSKLLARRAGTSLQTLVIDEGFGSQDDEGLTHIMDALYKIQSDFEKIIIVSHLPTMKDQFPVHFVVRKGADGSHVDVFEQG